MLNLSLSKKEQNEALLLLWEMCKEIWPSLSLDWSLCRLKKSHEICYDDFFPNSSGPLHVLYCTFLLKKVFKSLDMYEYKEEDGSYGQ